MIITSPSGGSVNASEHASTSGAAAFASHTLTSFLMAVVGVNAVGVVANSLLLTGLMLLRGRGYLSGPSVQMLAQQASADFLINVVSIA